MADVQTLLRELRTGLEAIYGPRLVGAYVFGSYARGEQRQDSDLDVLIVLDRVSHYASEVDRTSGLIASLSIEHGVSISRVFASEADWRSRRGMLLQNVHEDAIPV